VLISICVMGALLFYRHRENIVRLLNGKESRLGKGKKPA
jgi:glycerol-3-phosphate acyltransferase PlsY